jgi:putative transposase
VVCSRKRVTWLMWQAGLSARRRRHHACTIDSQHEQPVADNLLGHNFTASAANKKWLGDITAI